MSQPLWTRRSTLQAMAAAPLIGALPLSGASALPFNDLAPRPPMGWNSWDSFGATINEEQARANAKVMTAKLLPHGYNIFTVDIQWYEPDANSYEYRKGAPLTMDANGRLMPAPKRFPSAADGRGFTPLAGDIHRMGMKFGIHLMRGVPRQAADAKLPVLGTNYTCDDICDRNSVCRWNTDMYGVDMSKPGAQDYYDSVFKLIASWGVDFVKVDDLSAPYDPHRPEIEAVRTAIDRSGRPMILSTSPGATPLAAADHIAAHANMWRISGDFWDKWSALLAQFKRLADWAPHTRPGAWPDADMLPLGLVHLGERHTNFTPDEQQTLMTLWSIARSPLIMGGDLRVLDEPTLKLLTNDEVLAVDQTSSGNRELYRDNDLIAWTAKAANGRDTYLALFNVRDAGGPVSVPVTLGQIGITGRAHVRDLWQRKSAGTVSDQVSAMVPPHGSALLRLTPA